MPSAQCRLVAGIGREEEVAVMLMTSGNAIGSAWGVAKGGFIHLHRGYLG